MADWLDPVSARLYWEDAARLDDEVLWTYLDVARSACLAFAPLTLAEGESVPENYRLAQVMQARNIFNAAKGSAGVTVDPETGYAAPATTPLDWHIRQLLTPVRAFGGVA